MLGRTGRRLSLGRWTQQVEAVVRQHEQAATAFAAHLALLAEDSHNLSLGRAEQLVAVVNKSCFNVLKEVLPNLLAFLWQSPENTAAVARLERDLEEFDRQLAKGQRHLRISDDNRNYVASRATEALGAVASVLIPRCSLASAKAARLIGNPNPAAALQALSACAATYQACYRELTEWFPDLPSGQGLDPDFLASQGEAAEIIRKLGLQHQALESLTQLTDNIEKLRKAVEGALEVFQKHFEPWPLLPPESLEQVRHAKALFMLLLNRPQAPAELCVEAFCLQANADIVAVAAAESQELQHFRQHHSDRIAFRAVPEVGVIAALRGELRSRAGRWWRWFSGSYHKCRKRARAFLNAPFPDDERTLAILGDLEAHERRRIAFDGSPAGTLLGVIFRGIETKWHTIEPTLAWLRELKSATQCSEVTAFVQSSARHADDLRSSVRAVDILSQLVELSRQGLSGLTPLAMLGEERRSVKLQKLCGALSRTEAMVKALAGRIRVQMQLQPHATFEQLAGRIAQLGQLQQSAMALRQHSDLCDPIRAASLDMRAVDVDTGWLRALAEHRVTPRLVDAIIGRKLVAEKHVPVDSGISRSAG